MNYKDIKASRIVIQHIDIAKYIFIHMAIHHEDKERIQESRHIVHSLPWSVCIHIPDKYYEEVFKRDLEEFKSKLHLGVRPICPLRVSEILQETLGSIPWKFKSIATTGPVPIYFEDGSKDLVSTKTIKVSGHIAPKKNVQVAIWTNAEIPTYDFLECVEEGLGFPRNEKFEKALNTYKQEEEV